MYLLNCICVHSILFVLTETGYCVTPKGLLKNQSAKSDSQVVHLVQPLPFLLVGQEVHEAQHLPVFLGVPDHHGHPLVHLYQQDQQDQ